MQRFAIISDDLTGGLDTGVRFNKLGLKTMMMVAPGVQAPDWDLKTGALVFNTESRDLDPETAYQCVRQVSTLLDDRLVYKKVDSTMRGNIGREIDALLDNTCAEIAILAPASPQQGRTVRAGRLFVHDVPLLESRFALDTRCPFTDDLEELLIEQSNHPVRHIRLSQLQSKTETRADERSIRGIFIVDAEESNDLLRIAYTVRKLGKRCIPCGSAGLAGAIADVYNLFPRKEPQNAVLAHLKRTLVVAGSRHPATLMQIDRADKRANLSRLDIDFDIPGAVRQAANTAGAIYERGEIPILTAQATAFRSERMMEVSRALGETTLIICDSRPVDTLVLTGGATAAGVCSVMGIKKVEIQNEWLPGIPLSRVAGGEQTGLQLVTKAGGFGNPDTLERLAERMQYADGEE